MEDIHTIRGKDYQCLCVSILLNAPLSLSFLYFLKMEECPLSMLQDDQSLSGVKSVERSAREATPMAEPEGIVLISITMSTFTYTCTTSFIICL